MKAVIQRVRKASVSYSSITKTINKGLVILVGIGKNDAEKDARWLADKILGLRVFPNKDGKFDTSVLYIKGDLLVVSQFTVYGSCTRGKRPDFTDAARPEHAIPLYEAFLRYLRASVLKVESGEFAADMLVEIHNDGPVTIIIDTEAT